VLDRVAAEIRVLGEQLRKGRHPTPPPGPYSVP